MASASSKYATANLTSLTGLVAVVTGGGTGLGLTIARTLEANGAKVYITGRRKDRLDEAAKLATQPGNIIPIPGSTTSHDDLQGAVDVVTRETGYIDLLVNNAGMTTFDSSPNARPKPTAQSSVQEVRDYYFNYRSPDIWSAALETNIAAVFTTSMAFLELLDAGNKRRAPEAPKSQIVVIGSTGGLTRFTDSFIYNASKAGVHHLMKNLGAFLVPFDIRTNIIAPGCKLLWLAMRLWLSRVMPFHLNCTDCLAAGFPTDMTAPFSKNFEATNGVMPRELVPQQRMGNEEELAGSIIYLASKVCHTLLPRLHRCQRHCSGLFADRLLLLQAGGYCNGAVMVLDGGFLMNHSGA